MTGQYNLVQGSIPLHASPLGKPADIKSGLPQPSQAPYDILVTRVLDLQQQVALLLAVQVTVAPAAGAEPGATFWPGVAYAPAVPLQGLTALQQPADAPWQQPAPWN